MRRAAEDTTVDDKKFCVNCKSTTTYVAKDKNGWIHTHWRYVDNKRYCRNCHSRLFYDRTKMLFKKKQIHVKIQPRIGQCKQCGKRLGDKYIDHEGKENVVHFTQIHHIKYHDNDPLKDTIELCDSCHGFTHPQPLWDLSQRFINYWRHRWRWLFPKEVKKNK